MNPCMLRNKAPENAILRRLLELKREKSKLIDKARRKRKEIAKVRVVKRKVNQELKLIRKVASGKLFSDMSPEDAVRKVAEQIRAVTPGDIFPKGLEREFDKLERMDGNGEKTSSIDISVDGMDGKMRGRKPVSTDDDDDGVTIVDVKEGVLDMSGIGDDTDDDTLVDADTGIDVNSPEA